MRIAVEKEYPDEEKHLPESDRTGMIPTSVEKLLREHERGQRRAESAKKIKRWKLKHGTLGDAAQPMENVWTSCGLKQYVWTGALQQP
eukprot:2884795-Karenia_brevis.AAC.1